MTDVDPDVAARVIARVAITRVVNNALLGVIFIGLIAFLMGMALTDGGRKEPRQLLPHVVLDAIPGIAILAFVVIGVIGIVRLGASRRSVLARLRHERLLILMLAIAVLNVGLYFGAWLVSPNDQAKYIAYVGMLGIVIGVLALVQRGRAFRVPYVVVDDDATSAGRAEVTENPENPLAWMHLALALSHANRSADAANAAHEVVRLSPNDANAHVFYAELADKYWVREEGLASAQEAVRLAPDVSLTHESLGNAYLRRSQLKEARASFSTALGIDPTNADARHNLALTELTRSPAAAAVGLTETVRLDPMHDLVTHNLRVALARLLSRTWYLLLVAGFLSFAAIGIRSQLKWTDLSERLILGGIDLIVVVVVILLFWRAARAGRLRALARFAGARDRALLALGWILLIGVVALIAIAVVPPLGQGLMLALLFVLFVVSRFIWFVWALNLRTESGAGQTPNP